MDPVAKRKWPRSGLETTVMGFGAAPIGNIFRPISEEDSTALIKAAWDAVGSEFGSRHTQYEMFYAGARFVTCGHSFRTFDWKSAGGLVDSLLSSYDLQSELARAQA